MELSPTHLKELCDAGDLGIKVSLVKIWSLVRKIEYRQAFFIYVPGDLVNKVEVTKIL